MTRFVDRGALVAGGIGAGMALVVVIALALIFPVPALIVIACVPIGVLIGAYANVRARRRWPRWRVLANALWAAAVTGLTAAALFLGVELTFMYLDGGNMPDGSRIECRSGPDCGYQRQLLQGNAAELAELGITSSAEYEAARLALMPSSGLILAGLTIAGGAAAGAVQLLSGWARREDLELAAEREPARS